MGSHGSIPAWEDPIQIPTMGKGHRTVAEQHMHWVQSSEFPAKGSQMASVGESLSLRRSAASQSGQYCLSWSSGRPMVQLTMKLPHRVSS